MATSAEDTEYLLQEYVEEARAITDQIAEICWYMRGGVERESAWRLSHRERKGIMKLIAQNIERTNKTGLPLL